MTKKFTQDKQDLYSHLLGILKDIRDDELEQTAKRLGYKHKEGKREVADANYWRRGDISGPLNIITEAIKWRLENLDEYKNNPQKKELIDELTKDHSFFRGSLQYSLSSRISEGLNNKPDWNDKARISMQNLREFLEDAPDFNSIPKLMEENIPFLKNQYPEQTKEESAANKKSSEQKLASILESAKSNINTPTPTTTPIKQEVFADKEQWDEIKKILAPPPTLTTTPIPTTTPMPVARQKIQPSATTANQPLQAQPTLNPPSTAGNFNLETNENNPLAQSTANSGYGGLLWDNLIAPAGNFIKKNIASLGQYGLDNLQQGAQNTVNAISNFGSGALGVGSKAFDLASQAMNYLPNPMKEETVDYTNTNTPQTAKKNFNFPLQNDLGKNEIKENPYESTINPLENYPANIVKDNPDLKNKYFNRHTILGSQIPEFEEIRNISSTENGKELKTDEVLDKIANARQDLIPNVPYKYINPQQISDIAQKSYVGQDSPFLRTKYTVDKDGRIRQENQFPEQLQNIYEQGFSRSPSEIVNQIQNNPSMSNKFTQQRLAQMQSQWDNQLANLQSNLARRGVSPQSSTWQNANQQLLQRQNSEREQIEREGFATDMAARKQLLEENLIPYQKSYELAKAAERPLPNVPWYQVGERQTSLGMEQNRDMRAALRENINDINNYQNTLINSALYRAWANASDEDKIKLEKAMDLQRRDEKEREEKAAENQRRRDTQKNLWDLGSMIAGELFKKQIQNNS